MCLPAGDIGLNGPKSSGGTISESDDVRAAPRGDRLVWAALATSVSTTAATRRPFTAQRTTASNRLEIRRGSDYEAGEYAREALRTPRASEFLQRHAAKLGYFLNTLRMC
ncbi:hypothetical protein SKAU_G00080550 [Synaphobranchus kaupii]|uniref:Uncharacterized protein n=1 Tax=Synaphobranchus kaupii TaxID=118154 RepID=A0A9Q1J4F6_SYNKA|nr:hypothetical protein SKAU_G00080550 [Synaphobranchus kaupii]